ncbi:hypothetical protein V6N11_037675 [Hibiscus sabdariffa]|uniref:RNase H type-1 domain-containing protein n=1 Tax=Hibiscus sabdariffa TaxID=183260 RepID=A0ABR2PC00_9ROSI
MKLLLSHPQNCYNSEKLGRRWCDTRVFSTRSAYTYLMDTEGLPTDGVWKRVWSLRVHQRIRTFLWITLHQRHLTNAERFRRHLATSAMCSIFYLDVEDLDHILRRQPLHSTLTDCWNYRFAILCWMLWKYRSNAIFNPDNMQQEDILARGHRLFEECIFTFVHTPYQNPSVVVPRLWSRTPAGWVRVNVDASMNIADGKAAIGCLFRNDQGSWINSFVQDVGRCSVLLAKLWAVHDVLAHSWTLGFRRVVIDTDCLEVVFQHVRRYQNAIGDRLVAVGRSSSRCVMHLPFPPDDLSALVEEEKEQKIGESVLTQDWHATANVVCFNLHIDPG